MIPVPEFSGPDASGRAVAVLGLGPRGLAAARSLLVSGARLLLWDERAEARARSEAEGLQTTDLGARDWADVAALVVTPEGLGRESARIAELAAMTHTPIVNDIELFVRTLARRPEGARGRLLAVTGARGKSTTAALIGRILKGSGRDAQVAGGVGLPALSLAPPHPGAIYVLDVSAEDVALAPSLKPKIAVLINAEEGRHESAAQRIFARQTSSDHAVVGVDDADGRELAAELAARPGGPALTPVSAARVLGRGVHAVGGVLFDAVDGRAHEMLDLHRARSLIGRHNWLNAASAYAVCRLLGLEPALIAEEIARFSGAPHRLEPIGSRGAVRFIDDSMARDPGAARAALATFENVYWIAGGKLAAGSLAALASLMPRVAKAYLIGEAAESIAAALKGRVVAAICRDLATAVEHAAVDAEGSKRADPVVLLSPACPAGEPFADDAARGDAFRDIVRTLCGMVAGEAA